MKTRGGSAEFGWVLIQEAATQETTLYLFINSNFKSIINRAKLCQLLRGQQRTIRVIDIGAFGRRFNTASGVFPLRINNEKYIVKIAHSLPTVFFVATVIIMPFRNYLPFRIRTYSIEPWKDRTSDPQIKSLLLYQLS